MSCRVWFHILFGFELEFNCIGVHDIANCDIFSQFQPQSKEELQTAVNLWIEDNGNAVETYGEINSWDVSLISDMSSLFEDNFNLMMNYLIGMSPMLKIWKVCLCHALRL